MTVRLLDMFRIGPGPSSSHTVGPMRAALFFRRRCLGTDILPSRVVVELRGSLSATGKGHGTDRAVLGGLLGWEPETCDCDALLDIESRLRQAPEIAWGEGRLRLSPDDVVFTRRADLPDYEVPHPNTMVFRALDPAGNTSAEEMWFSVGGGFVQRAGTDPGITTAPPAPPEIAFRTGDELVAAAKAHGIGLGEVVLVNERAWQREPGELEQGLDRVWAAFRACAERGLARGGDLPGGLGVRRRARELMARVKRGEVQESYRQIAMAQAYAFAINEENAAGGQVVTAPTNGAAGVFPGVLLEVCDRLQLDRARIHRALATAGAIGMVIKTHASLSGAEVGCQGEVGSATAMAAAALCEILGGNADQVENAAEIGLEHNLGLTCDPMKGLVQAPCIERNAMGVAKAWSAAQLALHGDGHHIVSLDHVIRVMKRTGLDMRREYKETSEGGLAVAIPEC
ncbi:MAG: L-serine ammonia-lyase [Planctomycetota bacterium]